MKNLLTLTFVSIMFAIVVAIEPNPPVWPNNVLIIETNDQTAQSRIDQIFALQGGHNPPNNGQFSTQRYAFLFKPGTHNLHVNVGYYTHVMGLGSSPYDTHISSVTVENGDFDYKHGALCNFWRMAENFYTKPTQTWDGVANSMLWAVSQASPLRRIVIEGNLQLYEANSGQASAGYSSGGYLSDLTVTGVVHSGSQQQFASRNSKFGSWNGASWNYVFVGCNNAPANSCTDTGTKSTTNIQSTPIIAEKPFIVFEGGKYYLAIPKLKVNAVGPSNYGSDIDKISFDKVFVARQSDTVATINQKLAEGLHIIFTPGIYKLTGSINVVHANTVVLGLGLANLVSSSGQPCIIVGNVDGVRISGLLLDAGKINSNSLLQWGSGVYAGLKSNPGILQDLFTRVGGPQNPKVELVSVNYQVIINSGNVILDDLWLWRADHYNGGIIQNSDNNNPVGIQVNGDNVIAYGLAVEHCLGDLVQWNGDNGEVYFYQSELPYDVTQANYGDKGFVSYRVNDKVNNHNAHGIGIYQFFRDHPVTVANAIKTPTKTGIKFTNSLSVFLSGQGTVTHIINNQGDTVHGPSFNLKFKCSYIG